MLRIACAVIGAVALACSGSIARASIITVLVPTSEQTSVIEAGDRLSITAIVTLPLTPGMPFIRGDVQWNGDWIVTNYRFTLFDGQGNSREVFNTPFAAFSSTGTGMLSTYATTGTYFPHFEAFFTVHAAATNPTDPRLGNCAESHGGSCFRDLGFSFTESMTLTVLPSISAPGPIAGAGLPGLILAGAGLLRLWTRRKRA
jgi:hypothetical protein